MYKHYKAWIKDILGQVAWEKQPIFSMDLEACQI